MPGVTGRGAGGKPADADQHYLRNRTTTVTVSGTHLVVSQAEEQVAGLQMALDSQLPQERQRKQQRMQQISQALDGSGVTQVWPHPSNPSIVISKCH